MPISAFAPVFWDPLIKKVHDDWLKEQFPDVADALESYGDAAGLSSDALPPPVSCHQSYAQAIVWSVVQAAQLTVKDQGERKRGPGGDATKTPTAMSS